MSKNLGNEFSRIWPRTVCTAGLLLLASCAQYEYTDYASPAPPASATTVTMNDGLVYTRVEQCSNLGAVESDPAFNAPPDGMALANWQALLREIYDDIHEVDKACAEGRFYTRTLEGKVRRYGLLSPAGAPLTPTPAPESAAAPLAADKPKQPLSATTPQRFFAEENVDFGVKPQRVLQTNVGTPTPTALPPGIGKTLSTIELDDMLWTTPINEYPLLVDVLYNAHSYTVIGAYYIPEGGQPGNFTDEVQQRFTAELRALTKGRTDRALVFFCLGAQCWESYNAVLRAYHAGYRNLYWYRGGITAWTEAGLEVDSVEDPLDPTFPF